MSAPARPESRKPSRMVLAGAAVLLLLHAKLAAFETLGITWENGAAPLWLNPNFPEMELSGTPDQQEEILLCAARTWSEQTRAPFAFQYQGRTEVRSADSSDGINALFFSNADGGDALAATIVSVEGRDAYFDIFFFATTSPSPQVRITNHWSGPGEPNAGEFDIQGVAVHELGHVLGLGHSNVEGATMYPSARGRALGLRTLHVDDRSGAEFLYGLRSPEPPRVEILSLTPAEGPAAGGNEVVLEGVNFTYTSDSELAIGGLRVAASHWDVESCGRIRVRSFPPHDPGPASITLTNAVGSTTFEDAYRYAGPAVDFVRGDANGDTRVDISDPILHLDVLFRGVPPGPCLDAADANDDGNLDISDAITTLAFLFQGGDLLPPHPRAGPDPTPDRLGCGR